MPHPTLRALLAAAVVAMVLPAPARADGHLPLSVGIGGFDITSQSSYVQGTTPLPVLSAHQSGQFGLEFSVGPQLHAGSYQLTAMYLSQQQNLTLLGPPNGQTTTITQIPVFLEDVSNEFGSVRLGGGLGYDFISYPGSPGGAQAGNGLVGDTFVQVGVGSSAALEAKYIFGQNAATSGIFIGVNARL